MREQALLINTDYRRALLAGLPLFRDVEPADVVELLQKCERRDLAEGELLLSPGDKNSYLFIVFAGALNVHIGAPSSPPVAILKCGDCSGEMSIIEERDPSAYVIAAESTHLLAMHQAIVWSMVEASHAFSRNLLRLLAERIRTFNRLVADNYGDMQKFERNATTDALTGLGNRHSMEETFPRAVERCIRNSVPVSLIMIDVDRFKAFNDKFGHVAGDRALSAVSQVLKSEFRSGELIARYGGDEFAVLLPGVSTGDALVLAERVRDAVSGRTASSDDSLIRIPVEISMGVAELGGHRSFDKLLRIADEALYRAKRSGRNAVSI